MVSSSQPEITIYSTCPQSKDVARADYAAHVAEVARWSEEAGCRGMLVYTDNGIADPWLVAQHVIANTTALRTARRGAARVHAPVHGGEDGRRRSRYLHGRAVDLNMVAGGFRNDLRALGDETPHDDRYDRTRRVHADPPRPARRATSRSRSRGATTA